MSKTVFIFPGQGAQYVGMGRDFYEKNQTAREVFDLASRVTGLDVKHLCFEENDQLNITEYTQIAMLADEVAILMALKERGIQADLTAGLSLGEYAALCAAGALDMADAFRLIRKRGIYMQQAVPEGGGMSAVLGLDGETVNQVCGEMARETGKCASVANYNCPGQVVITGEADALAAAGEKLKAAGAKRVLPLKVSGPFHSAMLKEAGEKLGAELENVNVHPLQIPYVANLTSEYVTDENRIKELLTKQVCGSVRWQQSVERMIADGADLFVEIGPGRTLSGFMKRINKEIPVINVDTWEDFEAAAEKLGSLA